MSERKGFMGLVDPNPQERQISAGYDQGRGSDPHLLRRARVRRILAGIAALICAFWTFYTVRLLVVTSFLTRLRPGGGGARIGVVVFPILALFFGWVAWRLWRGAPRERAPTT
jgi:hypothetical protein